MCISTFEEVKKSLVHHWSRVLSKMISQTMWNNFYWFMYKMYKPISHRCHSFLHLPIYLPSYTSNNIVLPCKGAWISFLVFRCDNPTTTIHYICSDKFFGAFTDPILLHIVTLRLLLIVFLIGSLLFNGHKVQ